MCASGKVALKTPVNKVSKTDRMMKTVTRERNMCGRFGLFAELDALAEQFNFDPSIMQDIYQPRWNIPPTVPVLTVQQSLGERTDSGNTASLLRWGMKGVQGKNQTRASRPLFNARGETVHRLPSFRRAFRERRCLVPADGFYEWIRDESGNRTPVWFHREDGAPIAFAGIWSSESTSDGNIDSCAIITCDANELVSGVHHRMPVILPPESYEHWLSPGEDPADLRAIIQPREWQDMSYYQVSSEVNRASNDYPSLLERAGQTGLW